MASLVLKAYWQLIRFHWYLVWGDFAVLCGKVRNQQVCELNLHSCSAELIVRAVDLASIWYWKRALCLQRSAAAACLLRQYGFPAKMVIGARPMPFKAHAWVELNGQVVNDKAYMPEMYAVLDKC